MTCWLLLWAGIAFIAGDHAASLLSNSGTWRHRVAVSAGVAVGCFAFPVACGVVAVHVMTPCLHMSYL